MAPRDWDELHLAEDPAVDLLQRLGYTYLPPETLAVERDSLKEPVLVDRLARALLTLNPWLSPENVQKAIRAITHVQAASLTEASERVYTALTYGIALEQDLGDGKKGQTVRFIDFDDPPRNELLLTRQYEVQGSKKKIIADLVLFVNGLPLAVIECKSPTLGEKWQSEAIQQLLRYQDIGDAYQGLGAPKLFHTVQLLVGCCGQRAVYGTVMTPPRYWAEWKTPFPLTEAELARKLGRAPTAQDILLAGTLAPESLLDLTRSFVVFDAESGKTIRKVCRYKQRVAVNLALDRIRTARKPSARGGVVWHTQGSGKSLTMLWLALKLRRDPAHANPMLVVVTDRSSLDSQIARTFKSCGFPNPERAESVRHLRELLSGPTGKTVMTTIQKFMDLAGEGPAGGKRQRRELHPVLNEATNIFVLVDEAHRTQYKSLAANLRHALPNACLLGFTGTPIDKQDRSTLQTFGPYIDTYTIEQAVADGATVPIFYESRLPELRIVGQTLDKLVERVLADRTPEEQEAVKKRYANEQAIAEAPRRIEALCLDLLDHYGKHIQPNGFKAQVVAVSREAAASYKETLDRLNGPQSPLIISVGHNDEERLVRLAASKDQHDRLIERFLDKGDPLSLLVVCDMLITGFDAPIEQVMYLDSPLREHTLLQAIARVNRKADGKTYGLVVDYWGVSGALQEALQIFSPEDVTGAMKPTVDELPRLQARHQAALRFFDRVKDRADLDQCLAVLEPEDVRAEFDAAFRRFSESLDMLLPDPRALPYADDLRWLGKVRQAAKARCHDPRLDLSECGAKVRRLIDEAVIAEEVKILVKEVSIFSVEFEEKVEALKNPEAKASEMEHAVRHEIHVKLEENPAFYKSLRERLEEIIEDRKQQRITAAKQLELLQALVDEVRHEARAAEARGLSEMGFAIYGLIHEGTASRAEETEAQYKALADLVEEAMDPYLEIVDWQQKEDLQREMRSKVKRQLRAAGMEQQKVESLTAGILDLAKARRAR